jgi:hypothetical protein
VVRAQVKRKPKMLRNVIEERRGEIADDERKDEGDDEKHLDLPDRHIVVRLCF